MRMTIFKRLAAVTLLFGLAACDSMVEVVNPNVVEAESIDPLADAPTFARSALQNFYSAWGAGAGGNEPLILSGAWFTNEVRVGDTFPTRNEYGRRIVSDANGTLNGASWTPIARAVMTTHQVLDLLRGTAGEDSNINVARAAFGAGYSLIYMAEMFCQSVINVGAPMEMNQAMDSAVARFQRAIAVGTANGTAEGVRLANASRVGLARAYLNKGDMAQAAAAAGQVPAGFEFLVEYIDDPANRARLGNGLFGFSFGGGRESIVVGPEWRAHADAGDERISYFDAGKDAQDGVLRLYSQGKYENYGAEIRLASKLEADYIAAEAGTVADQLALIALRRAAAGVDPYVGPVDPPSVLRELLLQKHLDLWLEGQRMGDFRRNPTAVSYILEPGDNYYKPAVGEVSNQMCWPVPVAEKDNNPNF
jgi:starch-binding outer membrane protein, SusD/RagB family